MARTKEMKLTRESLISLARKSLENARALIEEAELLFDHKRWDRTVFLCHAPGEELPVLVQGRDLTLYSDIFSDGTAFAPTDVIPERIASDALSWAKGRLAMAEALIKPLVESD